LLDIQERIYEPALGVGGGYIFGFGSFGDGSVFSDTIVGATNGGVRVEFLYSSGGTALEGFLRRVVGRYTNKAK
jgi:hypothetical protein